MVRVTRFVSVTALVIGVLGVAASAPVASATTPRSARHPLAALGTVAVLDGIACPTSHHCLAGGADNDLDGKSVVINASTGAAKAWSGHIEEGLNAVACPTSKSCLEVANDEVVRANTSTGALKVTAMPPPPKNEIVALSAIACPTAKSCYAVGFEGTEVASHALIVHLSGTGKLLGKIKTSGRSFSAIACPTAIRCIVTGAGGDQLLNKGHLGKKHAFPTKTYTVAVTCFKTKVCFALIGHIASGVTNELIPLDPRTGSADKPITFSGMGGAAIACATANRCVIVGGSTAGTQISPAAVVVTNDTPGPVKTYRGEDFRAVACPTAKTCYAVGNTAGVAILDKV